MGTPVGEGIRATPFSVPWRELIRDSKCIGIEVAEIYPLRDHSGAPNGWRAI